MAQTEPVTAPAGTEDFDISTQGDVAKLKKGAVGLGGVLFLTLTGSATITAMLLNTPIVVGSRQGTWPPGAFDPSIGLGLGREIGFGSVCGTLVAYGVFEASLAGAFCYFAILKLASL